MELSSFEEALRTGWDPLPRSYHPPSQATCALSPAWPSPYKSSKSRRSTRTEAKATASANNLESFHLGHQCGCSLEHRSGWVAWEGKLLKAGLAGGTRTNYIGNTAKGVTQGQCINQVPESQPRVWQGILISPFLQLLGNHCTSGPEQEEAGHNGSPGPADRAPVSPRDA